MVDGTPNHPPFQRAEGLGYAFLPAQPFQCDADLLFRGKVSTCRAPNVPDRVFRRLLSGPDSVSSSLPAVR
jgi:hypothetical protein